MKILLDDLWFCCDCTIYAVNGDFNDISDKRAKKIERCAEELAGQGHLVPDFDTNKTEDNGHEEFSRRSCDCCDSGLAGEFHRFAVLINE